MLQKPPQLQMSKQHSGSDDSLPIIDKVHISSLRSSSYFPRLICFTLLHIPKYQNIGHPHLAPLRSDLCDRKCLQQLISGHVVHLGVPCFSNFLLIQLYSLPLCLQRKSDPLDVFPSFFLNLNLI